MLMDTYGVVGLALGTAIGIWVNLVLLVFLATRRGLDGAERAAWPHSRGGRRRDAAACDLRLVRAGAPGDMDCPTPRLAERDSARDPRGRPAP